MRKHAGRDRPIPAIPVEQLKRYGYSAAIILGALSMGTVLLFGSPTFDLSPATITFDYIVYPILILIGVWLIRSILSGRIAIQRFEKPFVLFGAIFVVSKFGLTMLTAPTALSLAFVESWYWLMVGIWTLSFLAYPFLHAMIINSTVYLATLTVSIANVVMHLEGELRFDSLSDLAASHFRLGAMLTALVILGYVKEQWVWVEKEAVLLRSIAHLDPLTELPNRRRLDEILQDAVETPGQSLTVILFDLDGFKEVNDRFGHTVGDEVLRQVSRLAKRHVGSHNTVGRWGGEEFLIVCRNARLTDGIRLAEELRRRFATHQMLSNRTITGSFGVAELGPNETLESLIVRADQALYAAKERGKNQVHAAVATP